MNKIYDFNEFLNESQRELPEDLMQQLKRHFNVWGELWLDPEGRVCCDGDVFVKNKTAVQKFPFQWGTVKGSFVCESAAQLTSLEGAPQKVEKVFRCSGCESLTSLKGAPIEVGGSFFCNFCPQLTSFEGAPSKVGGSFNCSSCDQLTSLKGSPEEVGGSFNCSYNVSLTSLKGAPRKVNRSFICYSCTSLTSLEGAPYNVLGHYNFENCTKVPEEELALAEQPELFKSWLKSRLELEDWKKEKRGLIASKKFGF